MATQTKTVINDENIGFRVEYDYDDGTLRITAIRVVNTGKHDVTVTGTRNSNKVSHQMTFLAGQTLVLAVPTTAAQRLQLFRDARNRLDGVTWNIDPQ